MSTDSFKTEYYTKPASNNKLLFGCAIAAIALVLLFCVACICFAIVISRQVASDQKISQQQKAWRLPADGSLPPSLRQSVVDSGIAPQNDSVLASIESFVKGSPVDSEVWNKAIRDAKKEADERVDAKRFIKEISNSGKMKDMNWLTEMVLNTQITADSFSPPEFRSDNLLLHAEWTRPNEEARAIVKMPHPSLGDSSLWVVWLVRKNDKWKLYDWQDMLGPMSEAEYYARYYNTDGDDSYSQFTDDIHGIGYNYSLADSERIAKISQRLKTMRVIQPLRELASIYAISHLADLNAWDETEKFTTQLIQPTTGYHSLLLSRAAFGKKANEKGIGHLRTLFDRVGWVPDLGGLVSDLELENEEDRMFVRQVQIQNVCMDVPFSPYRNQIECKDPNLIPELMNQLSKFPDAPQRVVQLVAGSTISKRSMLVQMLDESSKHESLTRCQSHVTAQLKYVDQDWGAAVDGLIDTWNAVPELKTVRSILEEPICRSAFRSGKSCDALQRSDDSKAMATILLNWLVRDFGTIDYDVDQIPILLSAIREQEQDEHRVLMEICNADIESRAGDYKSCLKRLVNLHQKHRDEKNDHPSGYLEHTATQLVWAIHSRIAKAAKDSNAWLQIRNQLQPPSLALHMMASQLQLPCQSLDLEERLGWYRALKDGDEDLWTCYYESQLHYAKGDWDRADDQLRSAIEKATQQINQDSDEDTMASSGFSPISDDATSEWTDLRITMATRCNRLIEVISKMMSEPKFVSENGQFHSDDDSNLPSDTFAYSKWVEILNGTTGHRLTLNDFDSIEKMLPKKDLSAQKVFARLKTTWLVDQERWNEAWDVAIQNWDVKLLEDYGRSSDWRQLIDIAAMIGKLDQLNQGNQELGGTDQEQNEAYRLMVNAIVNGDQDWIESNHQGSREQYNPYYLSDTLRRLMQRSQVDSTMVKRDAAWWQPASNNRLAAAIGIPASNRTTGAPTDLAIVRSQLSKAIGKCAADRSAFRTIEPKSIEGAILGGTMDSTGGRWSVVLLDSEKLGLEPSVDPACGSIRWFVAIQFHPGLEPVNLGDRNAMYVQLCKTIGAEIAPADRFIDLDTQYGLANPDWSKLMTAEQIHPWDPQNPMPYELRRTENSYRMTVPSELVANSRATIDRQWNTLVSERISVLLIRPRKTGTFQVELEEGSQIDPTWRSKLSLQLNQYELHP
jgi:hypothetical protein